MERLWRGAELAKRLNEMITTEGAIRHPEADSDGDPRLIYQRDRDRIVWAPSFKRLAQKTQVFPQAYGDHFRRRLTHSLEVAQLATSIARNLGLNPIACEAIALAHDLGHAPFGHAGEDALDEALHNINWDGKPTFLTRFTHYEHGIDVVSYVDSRDPDGQANGLHLQKPILEGVFKHTYDHGTDQNKHKSLSFLIKHTKYTFDNNPGPLEAQVVRMCDKISYFISDIEDGLIIGAIHVEDLLEHQLLKEPLEKVISDKGLLSDWRDHRIFLRVRDQVITRLVTSLLEFSNTEVIKSPIDRIAYPIAMKDDAAKMMKDVYERLQKGIIFKHYLVDKATRRANHIVSCLFCQYVRNPELIPWSFRRRYLGRAGDYSNRIKEIYQCEHEDRAKLSFAGWAAFRNEKGTACTGIVRDPVDRRVVDVICAKDYVAGMTDQFAEESFSQFVDCPASFERWNQLSRVDAIKGG